MFNTKPDAATARPADSHPSRSKTPSEKHATTPVSRARLHNQSLYKIRGLTLLTSLESMKNSGGIVHAGKFRLLDYRLSSSYEHSRRRVPKRCSSAPGDGYGLYGRRRRSGRWRRAFPETSVSGASLAMGQEGKDCQNYSAYCCDRSEHNRHCIASNRSCDARTYPADDRDRRKNSQPSYCVTHRRGILSHSNAPLN